VSDALLHSNCLVLDVAMPVMSGPWLFHELHRSNLKIPVIFITSRKNEAIRVRC
jgi:FixJ family two-component response regulator